jgi:hypothetical protein
MGNGCSCNSIKRKKQEKDSFPTLKTQDCINEMTEFNNSDQGFFKENFIGPYFLLDIENESLTFKEKQKYILKLNYLLKISEYESLFKGKYNLPPQHITVQEMNSINHKEMFLNFIFTQDLLIINSKDSINNLINYFEKNSKELKKIIFKGPPQIFRSILWRILLNKNKIFIKLNEYTDLNKLNLNEELLRQIKTDLPRTFPESKIYKDEYFREKLKKLLEKLACYDQELNYVQGLNFIIGYLLLVDGGNEFSSFNFFLLVQKLDSSITNDYFRGNNFKFTLLIYYIYLNS